MATSETAPGTNQSHAPSRPAPLTGRRIRVAVIGTGAIARDSHLPALARLAGEGETDLVAAVDITAESVESFCTDAVAVAATGGGVDGAEAPPRAYTELDVMLQEPERITLETRPVPTPGPGEVQVEVRAVSVCGVRRNVFHGSDRSPCRRFTTLPAWKLAGFMRPPTSSQCSGVETGAPDRARTEYAATVVDPGAFRR